MAGIKGLHWGASGPVRAILGGTLVCLLPPRGKMAVTALKMANGRGYSFPHFHKVFHIKV